MRRGHTWNCLDAPVQGWTVWGNQIDYGLLFQNMTPLDQAPLSGEIGQLSK
jgi:hypothetical protein